MWVLQNIETNSNNRVYLNRSTLLFRFSCFPVFPFMLLVSVNASSGLTLVSVLRFELRYVNVTTNVKVSRV